MKTTRETYKSGKLVNSEEIEVPDADPHPIEIRLAALEAKVGITEQDKDAALEELKAQ